MSVPVELPNISLLSNGTVTQKDHLNTLPHNQGSKNKKKQRKSSTHLKPSEEFHYERDKIMEGLDSPYSDIDSVPQIRRCPKSSERISNIKQSNSNPSQLPITNDKEIKKNVENQGGLWFSKPGKGQVNGGLGRAGIKSVNCSFGKVSCKIKMPDSASMKSKDNQITGLEHLSTEARKALGRRVKCLPASSRLMTRALKAMEEEEFMKKQLVNQESTSNVEIGNCVFSSDFTLHETTDVDNNGPSKKMPTTASCDQKEDSNISTCTQLTSDLQSCKDNEHSVKSEDETSLISQAPVAFHSSKFKQESHISDVSSSSTPSLCLNMEDMENMKELTFKSLANEHSGQPLSFHPDANYKFSTFLMMLKDMHDSRENDGTALLIEPLPKNELIKEEPSLIPNVKDELTTVNTVVTKKSQLGKITSKQKKMKLKYGTNSIPENHLNPTVSKNAQRHSKKNSLKKKTTVVTSNIHFKDSFDELISELHLPSKEPETSAKFSANVPKKRWQRFDQVNNKALHADEGGCIQETKRLPSENCEVLVGGIDKSFSFVPEKATSINALENTQANCQNNDTPTGKVDNANII